MSEKTINREALLKTANLVRPALASQAYIPALTHICFDAGRAVAYNDIAAISVELVLDLERCVNGEMLIKSLGTLRGESVLFTEDKDGALVMKSGTARIKLPTLPNSEYPLEWPKESAAFGVLDLKADIIKGIERCLISVGNDPTHPSQMGVTLAAEDGLGVLYSTDSFSISRYQTSVKVKLPGDAPVIIPRFFCEQLVSLNKTYGEHAAELELHDGALVAVFGKVAKLMSRVPVDLEPLSFERVMNKHVKLKGLKDSLFIIPSGFDSAFERALLVLSSEIDKVTKIELDVKKGKINMHTTSPLGDADDVLVYEADDGDPTDAFHVDPQLVKRAAGACALMGFGKDALVMADEKATFVHIVAHCSK